MFWVLGCPLDRMEVKPGFGTQQKCPLVPGRNKGVSSDKGNNYKDYVNIFPGPNSVSPDWRCPRREIPLRQKIHSLISRTAVNQEEAVVWRKETSVDFPLSGEKKL